MQPKEVSHWQEAGKIIGSLLILMLGLAGCTPGAPPAEPPTATATAPPASPTATPTPEPTATDTPTETPTATPTHGPPMADVTTEANCRRGPGIIYDVITAARAGSSHLIVGQSQFFGPMWWQVRIEGIDCWIWSGLVETSGAVDTVEMVPAPATPTPRPTPVISPTPRPLVNPFPITIVNEARVNLCFLFIVASDRQGWGQNALPRNAYLPDGGRISFNVSSGKYNLRVEDCKDDVVEILTDFTVTEPREWLVDGDDGM